MPLTTAEHVKATGPSGPKCPKGRWKAKCLSVEPGDIREKTYEGKTKREKTLIFVFAVTAGPSGDVFEVKRTYPWKMYKDETGIISHLRRDLESWAATPFPSQEVAEAFDLQLLVDKECTVQIDHNNDWVNITGIAPKEMAEVKDTEMNWG